MTKSSCDEFRNLTFLDLESWAGAKIVSRGKSYQRNGLVKDLGRTEDGRLVAWVEGTHRYATVVSCEGGKLDSQCSCPYWDVCKHAVAVVLEYLTMIKEKKTVPLILPDDRRLRLIDDLKIDENEEEFNDFEEAAQPKHKPSSGAFDLEVYLKSKSKQELIQLLLSAAKENPDIEDGLRFKAIISSGSVKKLVQTIRAEIERASNEPGWWNSWENEGYFPDYSRVQSGLQKLLDSGHADEVVALGEFLYWKGQDQVGQSDDDGDTAMNVAESLKIVFEALKICSLSDVDKMEKAVDFELEDSYGLCEGIEIFWEYAFDPSSWSSLADRLLARLQKMGPATKKDDFDYNYGRDRLADHIVEALENAGRSEEVIPLCMAEAENTHSYTRLVKLLREAGRTEEAEAWIRKGYAVTRSRWSGIARKLQDHLLEIKKEKRDWPFIAALKADAFFETPSLSSFLELQKAAKKVNCWPKVRTAALQFLKKGIYPDAWGKQIPNGQWPLPCTGFPKPESKSFHQFPIVETLIEIAIKEKNPEEVVRWYEIYAPQDRGHWAWTGGDLHDRTASAIANQYPDKAVTIWKYLAESHIIRTSPKEYMEAARYLKKMKKLLEKPRRVEEWKQYMALLRSEHRRKRKLMEILDGLEGKPICEQ